MRRSPPISGSTTTSSLRRGLAFLGLVLVARSAPGQGLTATEFDMGTVATWARRDFYGVSLGVAHRPSSQGRAALSVAGGALDGDAAVRIELTTQFLVLPDVKTGVSPYAGLGIAYMGARHYRGTGALVALVGVEGPEGRRRGWFVELGVGGGVRLRAGHRWRRLPR